MNRFEMKFDAKLENISFARSTAMTFLHSLDLTIGYANELKTIISEGVTNSIIHGYCGNHDEQVELYMSYDDKKIIIEISDNGIGIKDVSLARQPMYSTASLDERSGLGFTIMEIFSDELKVESQENIGTYIRCVKLLPGEKIAKSI